MKQFMDEDFLLKTDTAKKLYHDYAENLPIFDYHCHLSAKDIYDDKKFSDITELWISHGTVGDHYKWRLMRNSGVSEELITGSASNKHKFIAFANALENSIGNPIYHWSNLELKRYFGVDEPLTSDTAETLFEPLSEFVRNHGARYFINVSNVTNICTTDDPVDDLNYHKLLAEDSSFKTSVLPTFRPDKVIKIYDSGFKSYILKLSEVCGFEITDILSLKKALIQRLDFFIESGCVVTDHSLERFSFAECDDDEATFILNKALSGSNISDLESAKFQTYIMCFLLSIYHEKNVVCQLHIKAYRNVSKRVFMKNGPDQGFDVMNDTSIVENLGKLFSKVDEENKLPKCICYSLDANDFEPLASLIFSYGEGGVPGKMQLGSAWWFLDNKDGMEKQLRTYANYSNISYFVGMLTDSRIFLSYARHEYFRRILCNYFGELIENGEYPCDLDKVGNIIKNICYCNAKRYFE